MLQYYIDYEQKASDRQNDKDLEDFPSPRPHVSIVKVVIEETMSC